LPDNVHIKHGRYYFVGQYEGKRRWVALTRVSEGDAALYAAYAKLLRANTGTISAIMDRYIANGMEDLSERTKRDYRAYIKRNLRGVFGESMPSDIDSADIYEYLERRKADGAPIVANREVACLSSIFNYAIRRRLAKYNPCLGVQRNKEKPKNRYVRDDEFLKGFEAAEDYVQDLMAGIYLMGLRPGEARRLLRTQITPKGIRWEESKTGNIKIIEWSHALQFFVTRATSRCESAYIFTNSRGMKWTEWGMHSALRRIRARVDGPTWTWHDLRAKAESDSEEGMGMLQLYKRMTRIKPVV
jgi:hypothetical protein